MPILAILLAAAAAITAGFLATAGSHYLVLVVTGCVLVATFSFLSPKLSLVLLLASMLLSPEMSLGAVAGGRSLVVRYDDVLIVIIFLAWFARTAIFKNKPFITTTPVQAPILIYTLLAIVSTAFGVLRGDIKFQTSFFYILKYVEYFLLYFMTVNVVETEAEVKKYLRYGLVVAVIVTIYAYYYYYGSGPDARATAPFEAPLGNPSESEPASLGGYFLIIFGILFAILSESGGYAFLLAAGMLIFMFPAFLLTFSRASYIGFVAMLPALFFLSRKRRLFMAGFFAAGILALALMPDISHKVVDRITMTYQGANARQTFQTGVAGSIKLEDSAAARVYSIKRVLFEKLPKHPVFGWGVTGVGIGDTQYALVLGEMGLLGGMVFAWMLYRLFYTARTVFRNSKEPLLRVLSLGFMVSLAGLLFQALGVNTFIVVRIMEPFWFVAALLSVLYIRTGAGKRGPENARL